MTTQNNTQTKNNSQVKTKKSGALCQECEGFIYGSNEGSLYKAIEKGREHAKETGHTVEIEGQMEVEQ